MTRDAWASRQKKRVRGFRLRGFARRMSGGIWARLYRS